MNRLQLSIIIVNYNVKYFLEQCLSSVVKACKNIDVEILVIDNDSTDGSKEFFSNRFPAVQFIWKNENAGFAKANNEALLIAKGEKILFLNPDTIVPEDCFEKCLSFFETNNRIGALGVHMIDGSGNYLPESKRGFPSLFTSFCKMTGLTALFSKSKLLAPYYLGHLPENEMNEVDVLSGAFMMVDKKLLDTIGGFDENFFMYAEDIDLSYRIQKAGYKNYYYPATTIIHFKGESTKKQTLEYVQHFYGAMLLFIKKHYGQSAGRLYMFFLQVVIIIKSFFARTIRSTATKVDHDKAFILSDDTTFGSLGQPLQQHFSQITQSDKISFPEQKNNAFIFCEPALSFKEMIEQMQQYKQQYEFFIYSEGTKSVVGSSDKNSSGIAFLL